MSAITATTMITPTHTPALNMPSTSSHPVNSCVTASKTTKENVFLIMVILFLGYTLKLPAFAVISC